MTLYELNQAGYASRPKMSKSLVERKQNEITDWLKNIYTDHRPYLMLLNNELHYYTIFNCLQGTEEQAATEVFSIAKDLGTLKSIEQNDNGAWEFWITSPDTSTNVYYLFDYTRGVIEI